MGEGSLVVFRCRSSGVYRPFIERLKKRGGVEPCVGETGRWDAEAPELLLLRVEAILWGIKGETWVLRPGRRGEVARGVAEGVKSSLSKMASLGVIGRGMPGIYPGKRGVGDVVREPGWDDVR